MPPKKKKKAKKKTIYIYSFGRKWGLYPGVPAKDTAQFVYDVRHSIRDPWALGYRESGTDPAIQKLVRQLAPKWLNFQAHYLRTMVKAWLRSKADQKCLNLYFTCQGGYQRSVAAAEIMASRLRTTFGKECEIIVRHQSLDKARAVFFDKKR